jgi:hypothetical protein
MVAIGRTVWHRSRVPTGVRSHPIPTFASSRPLPSGAPPHRNTDAVTDRTGPTTVTTVLFDVGGVLLESPFRQMAPFAAAYGIDLRTFAEIAVGHGAYGEGSHPWHRIERGEISLDQFNAATVEMAKDRGLETFPPLPDVGTIARPELVRPSMVALAKECLFLDDMPENIEGALAVGMQALLVDETDSVISDVSLRLGW